MGGRPCSICELEAKIRLEVDRALVSGRSNVAVSREFRELGLSPSALQNHRDKHLSRQLLQAHGLKQTLNATLMIEDLNDLIAKTKGILEAAEQHGIKLQAVRTLQGLYEMCCKLVVTLHDMKAKQAEESAMGSQTIRAGLKNLNADELETFRSLLEKVSGQLPSEPCPMLPAQRSSPTPGNWVIDVSPQSQDDDDDLPLPVDEEPAQEPPKRSRTSAPPMAEPTPAPKPRSASQVDRSRREVAERIAGTYLEPWRARHACDDPPSVSEQLQRRGLL